MTHPAVIPPPAAADAADDIALVLKALRTRSREVESEGLPAVLATMGAPLSAQDFAECVTCAGPDRLRAIADALDIANAVERVEAPSLDLSPRDYPALRLRLRTRREDWRHSRDPDRLADAACYELRARDWDALARELAAAGHLYSAAAARRAADDDMGKAAAIVAEEVADAAA